MIHKKCNKKIYFTNLMQGEVTYKDLNVEFIFQNKKKILLISCNNDEKKNLKW